MQQYAPSLLLLLLALIFFVPATTTTVLANNNDDPSSSLQQQRPRHLRNDDDCQPVTDASDFLEYQQFAQAYLLTLDDVILSDDDSFYYDTVVPFQADTIQFEIAAGPRVAEYHGTDQVSQLFSSLATRQFGFHTWHQWTMCVRRKRIVVVQARYHGIVQEEGLPPRVTLDLFGTAELEFDRKHQCLERVRVVRTATMDR